MSWLVPYTLVVIFVKDLFLLLVIFLLQLLPLQFFPLI